MRRAEGRDRGETIGSHEKCGIPLEIKLKKTKNHEECAGPNVLGRFPFRVDIYQISIWFWFAWRVSFYRFCRPKWETSSSRELPFFISFFFYGLFFTLSYVFASNTEGSSLCVFAGITSSYSRPVQQTIANERTHVTPHFPSRILETVYELLLLYSFLCFPYIHCALYFFIFLEIIFPNWNLSTLQQLLRSWRKMRRYSNFRRLLPMWMDVVTSVPLLSYEDERHCRWLVDDLYCWLDFIHSQVCWIIFKHKLVPPQGWSKKGPGRSNFLTTWYFVVLPPTIWRRSVVV